LTPVRNSYHPPPRAFSSTPFRADPADRAHSMRRR
jgi:hypothetical protein